MGVSDDLRHTQDTTWCTACSRPFLWRVRGSVCLDELDREHKKDSMEDKGLGRHTVVSAQSLFLLKPCPHTPSWFSREKKKTGYKQYNHVIKPLRCVLSIKMTTQNLSITVKFIYFCLRTTVKICIFKSYWFVENMTLDAQKRVLVVPSKD